MNRDHGSHFNCDPAQAAELDEGGGTYFNAAEFEGRSVPSKYTLERANYAAFLARRLQLPVITTGGYGETAQDSEGYVTSSSQKVWQLVIADQAPLV